MNFTKTLAPILGISVLVYVICVFAAYFSDHRKLGEVKSCVQWVENFYTVQSRYPEGLELDCTFTVYGLPIGYNGHANLGYGADHFSVQYQLTLWSKYSGEEEWVSVNDTEFIQATWPSLPLRHYFISSLQKLGFIFTHPIISIIYRDDLGSPWYTVRPCNRDGNTTLESLGEVGVIPKNCPDGYFD